MTKPATLQIDPRRWRMLFADNIQITANFMAGREILTEEDLASLLHYLDEAKLMARAWYQAAVPAKVVEAEPVKAVEPEQPVKKKPGWPLGKPRKRQKPAEVMQ